MNKKLYKKIVRNVSILTKERYLAESLAKILLESYLYDINRLDIESLIIVLTQKLSNMKKYTENLNVILKI